MKTIMYYLKATNFMRIIYGNSKDNGNLIIKGYSNSNWSDDYRTKKSISGFIFLLNSDPVSWYLKRQAIVALLLTKAKYIALTITTKNVTWLRLLLTKIGLLDRNGQYAKIKVI